MDFTADPAHIITDADGAYVRADPFLPHEPFTVYMDDLRAVDGADVADVYDGPLYTSATGGPTSFLKGIKKEWTNSAMDFGGKDARLLWALALGVQMMQKVKAGSPGGVFTADDRAFAAFVENHLNRVLHNIMQYDMGAIDNRFASNVLIGLCEYFRIMYVGAGYGTYTPLAVSTNAYDTPQPRSAVSAKIDEAIDRITASQYRTTDWRDGVFIDDADSGHWQAWGQLQIYALAMAYRLKVDQGQDRSALSGLLDVVTYSADRFYGTQAYHYADPSEDGRRTRERITSISAWTPLSHADDTQVSYHNSSIVAGLAELAEAYGVSGRADAAAGKARYLRYAKIVATWFLGNNSIFTPMIAAEPGPHPYSDCGAFFDEIRADAPAPYRKDDAGGESSVEGVWAMVLIHDKIAKYDLGNTYTFSTRSS
jgi:hypothetical protein